MSNTAMPRPHTTAHHAAHLRDVLIAEADHASRKQLSTDLADDGFTVTAVRDGIAALEHLAHARPSVIVLDTALPRIDGLSIVRRLRRVDDALPALLLTTEHTVTARVNALLAGADDCISTPAHPAELAARLHALVRRADWHEPHQPPGTLTFADMRMHLRTRELHIGQHRIPLTYTESAILETFLTHPGQVLTRRQLYDTVWGPETELASNSLEVHMTCLRRKTEANEHPRLLHTARGIGYVLRATPVSRA